MPWHLTTREVAEQVRDVLTGDGVYAVNVIDYQPDRFARAEVGDAAVGVRARGAARRAGHRGRRGRRQPHPGRRPGGRCRWPASERRLAERNPWLVADERATAAFAGRAEVLTDAHAPVDQLITQFSR